MKGRALLVFVLFVAATVPSQSPPASPILNFIGTWKAEFHKQTWLVLTLVETKTLTDSRYPGGILTGTLMHSTEISADDAGNITRIGDEMSADKIVQIELQGEALQLTTRDEEGNEDHYTLVLTGKDTADLQTISESSAAPKPFKLKRASDAPK